jgi:polyvinyl alcohol dehydrogenase (cytochrome)
MVEVTQMVLMIGGLVLFLIAAPPIRAQEAQAFSPTAYFQKNCGTCHAAEGISRAPSPAALRALTPEAVYSTITTGSMKERSTDLTDLQRIALAETLTERKYGVAAVADAKAMTNPCGENPPLSSSTTVPNGYGFDLANTRFRSAQDGGFAIGRVANLKLKWAFGFPGVSQMIGQPTIADGRLFIGSTSGYVYGLNASTGCIYWSFLAAGGVRTAPVFGPSGGRPTLWFGDMKGNVYAIDAHDGRQIWKVNLDPHLAARITGSPVLHNGVLYVPVSSVEEAIASAANYECCTFRGSVAALDARTGRKLWQTYTIAQAPRRTRRNSAGTQLWGPAGGGVWGTPLIDAEQGALYVGTGDSYSSPAPATTDAVMAFNLKTGVVLWVAQDLPNDAWIVGCNGPKNENCPEPLGPDYDFGAALILHRLPDGKRVLLAGQKSGIVWAHDPDNKGAVLWKTNTARKPPTPVGEIVWGGAADDRSVYYGLSSGGVVALNIADGAKKWLAAFNDAGAHPGSPGAVTAMPGVVFAGGLDGVLRVIASEDGRIVREFDTTRDVQTVNSVKARGGSLGAPGPVVANGMLYIESGFIGVVHGQPGNLLLAFSDSSDGR